MPRATRSHLDGLTAGFDRPLAGVEDAQDPQPVLAIRTRRATRADTFGEVRHFLPQRLHLREEERGFGGLPDDGLAVLHLDALVEDLELAVLDHVVEDGHL